MILSDTLPRIQILGSERPFIVGQLHNATCLVETFCKEGLLCGTLDQVKLPGNIHVERNDDNSTTLISKLSYDFTVRDEAKKLSCVVGDVCINKQRHVSSSMSKVVDVHCEYSS